LQSSDDLLDVDNDSPCLGDLVYQVELSAHPATEMACGRRPTRERVEYLTGLIAALSHAQVLLFHGKASDLRWERDRLPIATQFLGIASPPQWVRERVGNSTLRWTDADHRRVIIANHITTLTVGCRERLAQLIKEGLARVPSL